TPDSVMDQYMATVRPSHDDFIEPSRAYADVIIPEGGLNRPAIDVLLARVRELAGVSHPGHTDGDQPPTGAVGS
ncbi:MAG: hypothetical protein VW708_08770, partial [Ilumatobacter sp.]